MKLHFITVGEPKLQYAKLGWDEYYKRLSRFHHLRVTHIADKKATDKVLLQAAANAFIMPLDLEGKELSSVDLATHLGDIVVKGKSEVAFIIGGPEGFGDEVRRRADYLWKLSELTLPHDLAMVVMLEALYRASTIMNHLPYHK